MPYDVLPGRKLPSTEQLLLDGGDTRIALDATGTSNKYGCATRPDRGLLAFASSTASSISADGFAAADCLRETLRKAADLEPPAVTYTRELDRIRETLLHLCGIADVPGLDAVFAASGTDLHLVAAQLCGTMQSGPLLVVMVGAEETGSGVAAALAGRHFSSRTALGKPVAEGTSLTATAPTELVQVPIRLADGAPRPAASIDAEVEALVSKAASAGQRVLLVSVDVSKTGMIAPSPACAAMLRDRYADAVDVMVDACQFRIASSTLRGYLEHGFMVALTGSKFLTGPTFSGALLIPQRVAQPLRRHPLPRALSDYVSRADWPSDWAAADVFDCVPNYGLLLRWEAALRELKAFRKVPDERITQFLHTFAHAITNRLQDNPLFEPLAVPPLDRGVIGSSDAWDRIPTIFPFLLFDRTPGTTGRRPLCRERTSQIYRSLQADLSSHSDGLGTGLAALRCQLGQPVTCGERDGIAISALRICASSRLIVEAAQGDGDAVIQRALSVLDKTAWLVRIDK